MSQKFNPQDHYFKQAKKDGFVARSAYKLEEIDKKFGIFGPKTNSILDIGCAPGSRLQYASQKLVRNQNSKNKKIVGFDLKKVTSNYPCVVTYQQDITDQDKVKEILDAELGKGFVEGEQKVDLILSDMAPDTVGDKSTDALRSISLIYDTMWIYHDLLSPQGKFVIKVFMGPGFEDFVAYCRQHRGQQFIKVFKPKACRGPSKETYVIKV